MAFATIFDAIGTPFLCCEDIFYSKFCITDSNLTENVYQHKNILRYNKPSIQQ